ncbi:MAG: mmsB [Nocardia sp.]|nr:mmsB [Nocardia sp.]
MARRIASGGISTTIWARRESVATAASEWGADVAKTPADLGAACDVIGICVFDAAGVEEVLFGTAGVIEGMAPGGVITVHSTVSPREIERIAEHAEQHRITILDAPVSGGPLAAEAGELLVLLAGPAPAAERAIPIISCYAGRIARFPKVGTAQLAKLLNNALLAAQVALVADAIRLGQEHGVGDGLFDVFKVGSARSYASELFAAFGSIETLARSQFTVTMDKDVRLLLDALGTADAESPLLNTAINFTRQFDVGSGSVPTLDRTDPEPDAIKSPGSNRRV